MKTIKDLKKNNRFIFNGDEYLVIRKWINDDKPLIAANQAKYYQEKFYHEGLEILIIK